MSWLSNLIYGKDPGPSATDAAFKQSTAAAGTAANAAQSQYMNDSSGFNPQAAYKEYAKGAYNDFATQFGQQLTSLKGSATGAGRFDSGFFDEDTGLLARNMAGDFENKLSQGALQASGQRLSQIGQEGQYALGQSDQYNSLLAGELDRETATQNAKRQERGDFWGGLFKTGAMIAAFA